MPKRKTRSWKVTKTKRRATAMSKLTGKTIQPTLRDSFKNTMIYYDQTYSIDPNAGIAGVQVFTLNGLFDVDITGVGHQPTGFDQFSELYNQYVVKRAFIKVKFHNTDSAIAQTVGIALVQQSATTGDVREYVENGNCVHSIVGPNLTGSEIKTLTHQVDITKIAGFNPDNDTDYAGFSGGNPPFQVYAHVFAAGLSAANPAAVLAAVEIRYEVEWRRPNLAAVS